MCERQREGLTAVLALLVGDDTSEEGKEECDAAFACSIAGLRRKRMLGE